jgi:hypothetical protein
VSHATLEGVSHGSASVGITKAFSFLGCRRDEGVASKLKVAEQHMQHRNNLEQV